MFLISEKIDFEKFAVNMFVQETLNKKGFFNFIKTGLKFVLKEFITIYLLKY